MTFHKAERKQAKLRLCLCGPSGSGKTFSAIKIALGLGGKLAMVDTENGSGELYAHLGDYDAMTLSAPYSPDRYVSAIKEAEKLGYNVLIIDSLTHGWTGEGGVLEMADKAAKASRSGNSYMAWREVTPQHNQLVDAILTSKMHIITTMRTKTDYVIDVNDKGKSAPRKVGLAPIQRDGMEYEFTVVLDLSVDGHIASSSKDRTGLFDGKHEMPSVKTGEVLLAWLNSGKTGEQVKEEEAAIFKKSYTQAVDEIRKSASLLELEIKYKAAYIKYLPNSEALAKLIKAKDERKPELEAKK